MSRSVLKRKGNVRGVTGSLARTMVLSSMALAAVSCGGGNQGMNMGGVKSYAVQTLEPTSVNLNSAYPASIQGMQDVEIRPRVSGYITKLCVDEGSVVKKGQALFLIDKVQYEAAVRAAEAAVKMAEAAVATSKLTLNNKQDLYSKNIISEYDLQTAQNNLRTAEAQLAQANAQLISSRQDLEFTTVTSPSAGVVGTIPYRVGALVSSSSAQPLTTVSDISKMYVYFSMTEKDLLKFVRKGGTVKELLAAMPEVELQLVDGSIYPAKGRIETLSGVIDKTTGAASIRATFPNDKNILRSGGTGNVLLPSQMDSILTVPQKATFELQDKKFVYVVTDSATVSTREIQIAPVDNGAEYVVLGGLTPGEKIVVEGVVSLREGMKIQPVEGGSAAAPAQPAAAAEAQQSEQAAQ